MTQETPDTIHDFWFGAGVGDDDAAAAKRQAALWWGKNSEVDAQMRERFLPWLDQAAAGALDSWAASPRGLLALILLTDQFSRNIHRGRPESFANDALARRWARTGLTLEIRQALRPIERVFMLMPFEHSEALDDQDISVREFKSLADSAPTPLRETFSGFVGYADKHRVIVARFGRFPHRNVILGRESMPEEVEFLKQPGSSF